MDADDLQPKRRDDPLGTLRREDLDPLSVTELESRIVALEAEIARTRTKLAGATKFRSAADGLFKR